MDLLGNLRQLLAENLARLRKSRSWNQHDLAAAAKVSVETVRNYEQQRRFPGAEDLEAFGAALDVHPWDLLAPADSLQAPPDVAAALARCGPSDWEVIRAMLRGLGKLTSSQAPTKSKQSSGSGSVSS